MLVTYIVPFNARVIFLFSVIWLVLTFPIFFQIDHIPARAHLTTLLNLNQSFISVFKTLLFLLLIWLDTLLDIKVTVSHFNF